LAEHESNEHAHHVPSPKPYVLTWAFLLAMTFFTVVVAKVDLPGPFNDIVALAIAGLKATAVIMFFMHVRHSSHLTKLTAASGLVWLAIMIFVTMSDYWTRGWLGTWY